MSDEVILKRIRALMAKTTDAGCTEEEATAAALKAQELIDKYNIEVLSERSEDEGLGYKPYEHVVDAKYADSWRALVVTAVAVNAGLYSYRNIAGIRDRDKSLRLVGREETVLAALEILTHIIKYVEAARPPSGLLGDKNTVRRQYQRGMAANIRLRLAESRNLTEHANLPALLEAETSKVEKALIEAGAKFTVSSFKKRVDSAFLKGYDDGASVALKPSQKAVS